MGRGNAAYLLTLWLFLLLPNSPWMITMGSPLALPLLSWSLYARSTAPKLEEAWNERPHDGKGVALLSCMREEWFASLKGALSGRILRSVEFMVCLLRLFRDRGTELFSGSKRHCASHLLQGRGQDPQLLTSP